MEKPMTTAAAPPIQSSTPTRIRASFVFKVVSTALLALLADFVLSAGEMLPRVGSIVGFLAFAWLGSLLACDPLMRRDRASRIAVTGASLAGFALIVEPGLLAGLLFTIGLGLALFLPRHAGFGNALVWAVRLVIYGILTPVAALLDASRLVRVLRRAGLPALSGVAGGLVVALSGALVFLALFSDANPLIGWGLSALWSKVAFADGAISLLMHGLFLAAAIMVLWASFRPLRLRVLAAAPAGQGVAPPRRGWPGVTPVVMALVTFNLVFAAQNLSDIAFLWSGVRLPEGVTFSQYAHRGTQALIIAALLAAGFVLVCLRTGSPLAERPAVRGLVYAWVGQTMVLVASTMLRIAAYIEAYSLTYLRIAALIFLVLVMSGLALICWRIARRHDGIWLINANALCLVGVLGLCCFVNFDGLIARWNLQRLGSSQFGQAQRDNAYIASLGGTGTLLALKEAGAGTALAQDRDIGQLRGLRRTVQDRLEARQADWRQWTLAGAWRLREAGPVPDDTPTAAAPGAALTPSP